MDEFCKTLGAIGGNNLLKLLIISEKQRIVPSVSNLFFQVAGLSRRWNLDQNS